ncbi:MAG: N-acetyltransferase [Burkholderiales bacterium]|nr:MAG: N-acetyltransferase [Betaproteobacteria bacterium]TAG84031.1 MAG: N-acetyltransferase [Burkholderiales bacterium]
MRDLADVLPLRSGNTVLRLMQIDDAIEFQRYRSDAELARYQGWSAISVEEAREFVSPMSLVTSLKLGDWVQLAIAASETNTIICDVGSFVDVHDAEAEIGFTLCHEAQGHGHATNAVNAAAQLIFADANVKRIRAVTDARNLTSMRVLERAAFRRVGEQRAEFKGELCTELLCMRDRE